MDEELVRDVTPTDSDSAPGPSSPQKAKPPVMTPVRHPKKRLKIVEPTRGQMNLSIPTLYDPKVSAKSIRLHHCIMEGMADWESLQKRHRNNRVAYQGQGDAHSLRAALQWMRDTARSFPASTMAPEVEMPNVPPAQRPKCSREAEAFRKTMLQRANILLCRLPIQTDGESFKAGVAEEIDSDDDDNEQIVEPLRTSDAQAVVGSLIRRRSSGLTAEEKEMIDVDIWQPNSVAAAYVRRDIQDVDAVQPWRALLIDKGLHFRGTGPLGPNDIAQVKSFGVHVPTDAELLALTAVTHAHAQCIAEITGIETFAALGCEALSARREINRWTDCFGQKAVQALEQGLQSKREGMEVMRRERVPHIRMYDVAEYYYKVWRTLATPEARRHYMQKVRERRNEFRTQPQARLRSHEVLAAHQHPQYEGLQHSGFSGHVHPAGAMRHPIADGRAPSRPCVNPGPYPFASVVYGAQPGRAGIGQGLAYGTEYASAAVATAKVDRAA
jgi:hypothetical protein